jgi:uncharacterized protein (DUF2235 family)
MAKKIIICCDGTGNEYQQQFTNVLKLYTMLPRAGMDERDRRDQIAYYDPGVGTFSLPAALTKLARVITKILGLAFGLGITQNISDAYQFLMENYEPGDKVYLFGFSRGAYTARALAAMLYKCGLLRPGRGNMLPYALKIFKNEFNPRTYIGFKRNFSRDCPIHFLGLWDTVKSVGWIYDPLTLQFTMRNPLISVVRQAIAIDERRCFYRQNLWGEPYKDQDVEQVWFAGAHCDVGGGYPEYQSGLSKIALKWMTDEAIKHGLLIDQAAYERVLRTGVSHNLRQKMTSDKKEKIFHCPTNYKGMLHHSLHGAWWIAEYIPKRYKDAHDNFKVRWKIPRGQRRRIEDGVTLHATVQQRLDEPALNYDPPNLPAHYRVSGEPTDI